MNIQKENNLIKEAFEVEADEIGFCLDQKLGDYENPYESSDTALAFNLFKKGWQAAKAQAVPDGFVLMPTTPSCEMWSGIARDLGRYMQMHDRYCPKTLKKYFDRFIGEIPEWLNKEVKDWDSDHAFATADLPAFIYMSMVEAQEQAND